MRREAGSPSRLTVLVMPTFDSGVSHTVHCPVGHTRCHAGSLRDLEKNWQRESFASKLFRALSVVVRFMQVPEMASMVIGGKTRYNVYWKKQDRSLDSFEVRARAMQVFWKSAVKNRVVKWKPCAVCLSVLVLVPAPVQRKIL